MNLARARFLKLALAIAAMTTSTMACSATTDDDVDSTENAATGGLCLPASDPIDEPATEADCDEVLAAAERQARTDALAARYSPESTRHRCNVYRTKFQPGPGKAAIDCLLDPDKMVYENIDTCGMTALTKTCRDPENVDALCEDILDRIMAIEPDADARARFILQCQTLVPGLTPSARAEVATCTWKLAREFSADAVFQHYRSGHGQRALDTCIRGLPAAP
jgi:hypothetical protein